jgi:hypothetical protein
MRREPTPESRHITRIIASLAKAEETRVTSSQKANQQDTENITIPTSQDQGISRAASEVARSDCRAKTGENAQILKAPANFGGQFSAPPRTFENVAAGAS